MKYYSWLERGKDERFIPRKQFKTFEDVNRFFEKYKNSLPDDLYIIITETRTDDEAVYNNYTPFVCAIKLSHEDKLRII